MDIRHLTGRIDPNQTLQKTQKKAASLQTAGLSFKEVLQKESGLEFSGHAIERLENRNITMNKLAMQRLEEAVSRAEKKGSKDSLVLDGERAFLVNIPNKKVITAMDMMELRDKVFTNIDSTVLTNHTI